MRQLTSRDAATRTGGPRDRDVGRRNEYRRRRRWDPVRGHPHRDQRGFGQRQWSAFIERLQVNQEQSDRYGHPQRRTQSQGEIVQVGGDQASLRAQRDRRFVHKHPQFEQARLDTALDLLHSLLIAGSAKDPQHGGARGGGKNRQPNQPGSKGEEDVNHQQKGIDEPVDDFHIRLRKPIARSCRSPSAHRTRPGCWR